MEKGVNGQCAESSGVEAFKRNGYYYYDMVYVIKKTTQNAQTRRRKQLNSDIKKN